MEKTICFTGPRIIGKGYDDKTAQKKVYDVLLKVIELNHTELGYNHFISGGAIGTDQIAADAVLYTRDIKSCPILLTIARPFPSQASKWPSFVQKKFHRILDHASNIVDVNPDPYAAWKMNTRNVWMVDHSSKVIAVWDGTKNGGTWNCIQYALQKGKEIVVIDPQSLNTYRLQ